MVFGRKKQVLNESIEVTLTAISRPLPNVSLESKNVFCLLIFFFSPGQIAKSFNNCFICQIMFVYDLYFAEIFPCAKQQFH